MEQLILPQEAWRKLNLAYGLKTSVYLYGATGFGKTTIVREFTRDKDTLWLSCREAGDNLIPAMQAAAPGQCIVIDDLQAVRAEDIQEEICRAVLEGQHWIVLIGRQAAPEWITPLVPGMKIVVISEKNLRLSREEIEKMLSLRDLTLSPEDLDFITEMSEGNFLALGMIAERLSGGENVSVSLSDEINRVFGSYLERYIICQWEPTVQDFLMQVSAVNCFTLPLAEAITGDDRAALILRKAMDSGNIIQLEDGVYRIRRVLLETLREMALKRLGRNEVNHSLYNAARYYELNDDVVQALALYEQCGENTRIKNLLIRNARRHPGVGHYYELRRYYNALSEEEISSSPVLMGAVSILNSILMDCETSELWYDRLRAYAAQAKGGDRQEAMSQLLYLDISLPHRGTVNMVNILKNAPALLARHEFTLPEIVITGNQPSLMNGAKDFCEWSKTDTLLAETIGPMLERLLGKAGYGLVSTALGESIYEKGAEYYTVLSYLARGQSESETHGTIHTTFAAIGLQARLSLTIGNTVHAENLLEGIEKRAIREDNDRILAHIRAARCRIALLKNDAEPVRKWLSEAPDENADFCTMFRYLYLTRARCYLMQGDDLSALSLLERLSNYGSYAKRAYMLMECGVLRAIAMRRLGMDWKPVLIQAMERAAEYKFIRVISEEGAAVLPLLNDIRYLFLEQCPKQKKWLEKVITETEQMAHRYPAYLRGTGIDLSEFSATALSVLRMQAAGYSTKEIADQLGISQRTVKYHAAENYRKLGAKGVLDAVQIARGLNIL